jgi:nucleotide-binding universal stress UspA family protein
MVALSATSGVQGLVAAYDTQDGIEAGLRAAILEEIPRAAVDAELVVRVGDPYTQPSAVACDVRADALVVGASTRAGHRIAGSLAVRLVRAGHGPVSVVP